MIAVACLVLSAALHEAALLLTAIFVAAVAAWNEDEGGSLSRHGLATAVIVAIPIILVTLAIGLHRPTATPEELTVRYADKTGLVSPMAVDIPFRSLTDNVGVVREWVQEHDGGAALTADVIAIIPVLGGCWLALRRAGLSWAATSSSERAVLLSALAPLALIPIGSDFGRWTSFVALTLAFGDRR